MDPVLCWVLKIELSTSTTPPLVGAWPVSRVIMIRRVSIKPLSSSPLSNIDFTTYSWHFIKLYKGLSWKPWLQMSAMNLTPNDFPLSQSSGENYSYHKVGLAETERQHLLNTNINTDILHNIKPASGAHD